MKLTTLESVIEWGLMNGFEVLFLPFEPLKSHMRCRISYHGEGRSNHIEVVAKTFDELFKRVDHSARSIYFDLRMKEPD